MHNVRMSQDGRDLVIRVSLDHEGRPSQSGKSTLIASTGGYVPAPVDEDGIKVSVNVIR